MMFVAVPGRAAKKTATLLSGSVVLPDEAAEWKKSYCDSTINKEKPRDIRESGRCCMSRCRKT